MSHYCHQYIYWNRMNTLKACLGYIPNSPPATEKSRGNIDHFCICWAFEVADLLTVLIAVWIASSSLASFCTSLTVCAELPWQRHQSIATRDSLSKGCWVSSLSSDWNFQKHHETLPMYVVNIQHERRMIDLANVQLYFINIFVIINVYIASGSGVRRDCVCVVHELIRLSDLRVFHDNHHDGDGDIAVDCS